MPAGGAAARLSAGASALPGGGADDVGSDHHLAPPLSRGVQAVSGDAVGHRDQAAPAGAPAGARPGVRPEAEGWSSSASDRLLAAVGPFAPAVKPVAQARGGSGAAAPSQATKHETSGSSDGACHGVAPSEGRRRAGQASLRD
eukprot:2462201-Lingulodinium_polyedra.AAC.1